MILITGVLRILIKDNAGPTSNKPTVCYIIHGQILEVIYKPSDRALFVHAAARLINST